MISKTKQLRKLLTLLLLVVAMAMPKVAWSQSDGVITPTEPALSDGFYQIGTAGELMWFMQHVADGNTSACCELTADIVLNTNLLQTIDAGSTPVNTWIMPSSFSGTFDGNGHTISGIYLPISSDDGAAMFKQLYGTIKELGVLDSYFGGSKTYHAATFAGVLLNNGSIIDCYSFAKIDGTYYNGGIAGDCKGSKSSITNCYFAGSITSTNTTSSPISCDYYDGGTITNCYYLSTVVNDGMTVTRSTSVTEEKMKSGRVAYALRAGRDKSLWGQELTNDPKDDYPTLSNRTVYGNHLTCNGKPYDDAEFNNNPATEVTQDAHTYGDPSITPPTCTENGYRTRTCSTCGHEEITVIDATGHTDEDGDHICDVCSGVASEQPTLVTMDNYVELGLSADYVGYRAIENMYHLYYFAECMNRQSTDWEDTGTEPTDVKFVLSKDIKVNEQVLDENGQLLASLSNPIFWLPVNMSFKGATTPIILDGNNHHISGLVKRSNYHNGFIEELEGNITIKNLGITDSYFHAFGDFLVVGSIAARLYNGKIENCWSDATIAAMNNDGNAYAGGLVGGMDGGSIIESSFSGLIITNNMKTAGIVSRVNADESEVMISKCRFSGTIQAYGNYLTHGGITGKAYPEDFKVTIEKCIADGKVVINGYENNIAGIIGNYETGDSYAKVINNISSLTIEDKGGNTNHYGLFGPLNINSEENIIACNINTNKNVVDAIYRTTIGNGVTPIISHNFSAGYADDDSNDKYTICTDETFASGKVAYLLNEYNKSALGNNEPVWYQLIGEENYPTFEGDAYSVVYHSNELGFYNLPVEMDTYTLTDGEAYERTRRTLVHNFTYNRTFSESQAGKWQAMYIPFKLSYADWSPYFDVAAINNFHEYTDENGEVKNVELEVRMVTKGSIKANSPCLIRPKTAGEVNIQLTEATLELPKSNAISCSSVGTKYTFTGIYQPLSNLKTMGCIFLTGGELREAADDEQVLKAQRWYLTREDLGNYLEETTPVSPKMSTIKIRVIGDDATGIEDIQVVRSMSAAQQSREGIYDLQGRQLSAPAKGLSIIRQANGSTRKVVVK